jgi:hypothetical protein
MIEEHPKDVGKSPAAQRGARFIVIGNARNGRGNAIVEVANAESGKVDHGRSIHGCGRDDR